MAYFSCGDCAYWQMSMYIAAIDVDDHCSGAVSTYDIVAVYRDHIGLSPCERQMALLTGSRVQVAFY